MKAQYGHAGHIVRLAIWECLWGAFRRRRARRSEAELQAHLKGRNSHLLADIGVDATACEDQRDDWDPLMRYLP